MLVLCPLKARRSWILKIYLIYAMGIGADIDLIKQIWCLVLGELIASLLEIQSGNFHLVLWFLPTAQTPAE